MSKTRSATEDEVVGRPAKFISTQLPSKLDVLKAYLYHLNLLTVKEPDEKVKSSVICDLVCYKVTLTNG